MESERKPLIQLKPNPGKTNTIRNSNGCDMDVTVRFTSGSSVTFLLLANGSFTFVSEGDVSDIDMNVRPELSGPTSIV